MEKLENQTSESLICLDATVVGIESREDKVKLGLKEIINEVYSLSKERKIHPCGSPAKKFVKGSKWYPAKILCEHMNAVYPPSNAYPFTYLLHCRTKKFITRLFTHYKIKTLEQALKLYTEATYISISNAEDFILFS